MNALTRLLQKIKNLPRFSSQWKESWQDELVKELEALQSKLQLRFVVIIAKESDLYSELLYFVSFLGMLAGTAVAFAVRQWPHELSPDPLILPLLGFTIGSLAHFFRAKLLQLKGFQKLTRQKVDSRARSYFHGYTLDSNDPVALLYISEMEGQARFLLSPEIEKKTPNKEIQETVDRLERNYSPKKPIPSLHEALENIGILLETHIPEIQTHRPKHDARVLFVSAADHERKIIPVIKGNKDIN